MGNAIRFYTGSIANGEINPWVFTSSFLVEKRMVILLRLLTIDLFFDGCCSLKLAGKYSSASILLFHKYSFSMILIGFF